MHKPKQLAPLWTAWPGQEAARSWLSFEFGCFFALGVITVVGIVSPHEKNNARAP